MKITTPRRLAARYSMTSQDETSAVQLAQRAGEQLDENSWLLVGGTRSLAGQLGRVLEHRIFDRETGPHSPESFIEEYGQFEDRSVHVTIVDREGVVATARNIYSPSIEEPTKLEVDLGFESGELRRRHDLEGRFGSTALTELATMVVEPRVRLSLVSGWLFGEIRRQQIAQFPDAPSCAMTAPALFRMLKVWGHEVTEFGGLASLEYLGMQSQPTFFEPGEQSQIERSKLFAPLSEGFFARVRLPAVTPVLDLTRPAIVDIAVGRTG